MRPDATRPWYVRVLDSTSQDEDEDLQELFEAFVQFVRSGKKMRSKSKGWKTFHTKGKGKGKHSSAGS